MVFYLEKGYITIKYKEMQRERESARVRVCVFVCVCVCVSECDILSQAGDNLSMATSQISTYCEKESENTPISSSLYKSRTFIFWPAGNPSKVQFADITLWSP